MKGATKILLIFIVVVVVVLVGYALLSSRTEAPTINVGSPPSATPPAATEPAGEEDVKPVGRPLRAVKTFKISYNGTAYSPKTITIKDGDIVEFVNRSATDMWPASAMHPTHKVYGGTTLNEHCPDTNGTAFDACEGIKPNESWFFKFRVGSWNFHDHLNPSAWGTIVVE